jgi:hypothetical protein
MWVLWPPGAVRADAERTNPMRPMALGFNLDLFPTVISAANGKAGYAPQVWLGIEPVRIRFVGAHLEPPDALAFADKGFRHPTTTAFAAILDYTTGPHFDGFWAGAGFELWEQSIEHDGIRATAHWTSAVFTVGGGYIWRFSGNFFLDPWLAAHATLNPQTIALGTFEYKPFPLTAEASLKIGWFADL